MRRPVHSLDRAFAPGNPPVLVCRPHPESTPTPVLHTLLLPPLQGSTRGGGAATPQLEEGREGKGEEARAGENGTRLAPKPLEPPAQDKGKWVELGAGCQAMVQAGGSSPGGAGKPLRSRPMISLTVKEGQLRDWEQGRSPPFPETPQSIPGRPPSRMPLDSSCTGWLLFHWASVSPLCPNTRSQSNLAQLCPRGLSSPHASPFLLAQPTLSAGPEVGVANGKEKR